MNMIENQIKKELSLRIKSYRKDKNLTQDEFGSQIGFEQKNISRLESGSSMPNAVTICKLIKHGIEPNYLFGFINSNYKSHNLLDFEIMDLITNLSNDSKKHLIDFLKSIYK